MEPIQTESGQAGMDDLATLHAIVCIVDNDEALQQSPAVDLKGIQRWLKLINLRTKIPVNSIELTGSAGTLAASGIFSAIEGLEAEPNDVIVYYYSGHGTANTADGGTRWPLQVLPTHEYVDLQRVHEALQHTGVRLTIALADCCNTVSSRPSPVKEEAVPFAVDAEALRRAYRYLLCEHAGSIIASGAKPEQASWSNNTVGGFFTRQFLTSFYDNTSLDAAEWDTIMLYAAEPIAVDTAIQEPQYALNVTPLS